MQQNMIMILMLGGIVSGFISYVYSVITGNNGVSFIPGLLFGLPLIIGYKKQIIRSLLLALLSTVGYIAAVYITIYFGMQQLSGNVFEIYHIFVAGIAGGLILSIGISIFFNIFSFRNILLIALASGILSLPFYLVSMGNLEGEKMPAYLLLLYMIWQPGIAALIGFLYQAKNSK